MRPVVLPFSLALLTLIALVLTGCALLRGGPPKMDMALPVEVMTIEETVIPETSQYLARLESRNAVMLKSQVTGRISSIMVQPGQPVFAGQPLIQLDASEQFAEVASRQQEVAAAQARVQQAEGLLKASEALLKSSVSNIEYQEKQLARTKLLLEKKAASPAELEKVTDALNKAHADIEINNNQINSQKNAVAAARKTAQQAQAVMYKHQAILNYYSIRAPFNGVVGDIPAREGDVVAPGLALAEVSNNNQLEINLSVPVDQAQRLKPGLMIRLMAPDTNQFGEAAITSVSSMAQMTTQTVLVKAQLVNSQKQFSVDQLVNAYIIWQEKKGIVIPTSSVMHAAGVDFVFVASADKKGFTTVKQRPVELGELQKQGYVVKAGLKPGEKIVSVGIQKIQDGMPIKAIPAQPKTPPGPPKQGNVSVITPAKQPIKTNLPEKVLMPPLRNLPIKKAASHAQ